MTQAMNFFQSLPFMRSFSSIGGDRHEIKLANTLKKDARRLAAEAEAEFAHGKTARAMVAPDVKEGSGSRALAEIAVWHFERSGDLYRRAAARFEEASRLQTTKQRDFFNNAGRIKEFVAQVECEINFLNALLAKS